MWPKQSLSNCRLKGNRAAGWILRLRPQPPLPKKRDNKVPPPYRLALSPRDDRPLLDPSACRSRRSGPVGLVFRPCALVDTPCALVDKPRALVDKPCALVDKPCALVDLSRALVDLSRALVDLPRALVDLSRALVNMSRARVEKVGAAVKNVGWGDRFSGMLAAISGGRLI